MRGAHRFPIPLAVTRPHAYEISSGTFDWRLRHRFDDMESEFPRPGDQVEVDPDLEAPVY